MPLDFVHEENKSHSSTGIDLWRANLNSYINKVPEMIFDQKLTWTPHKIALKDECQCPINIIKYDSHPHTSCKQKDCNSYILLKWGSIRRRWIQVFSPAVTTQKFIATRLKALHWVNQHTLRVLASHWLHMEKPLLIFYSTQIRSRVEFRFFRQQPRNS